MEGREKGGSTLWEGKSRRIDKLAEIEYMIALDPDPRPKESFLLI